MNNFPNVHTMATTNDSGETVYYWYCSCGFQCEPSGDSETVHSASIDHLNGHLNGTL
jgi:hypothetical protein